MRCPVAHALSGDARRAVAQTGHYLFEPAAQRVRKIQDFSTRERQFVFHLTEVSYGAIGNGKGETPLGGRGSVRAGSPGFSNEGSAAALFAPGGEVQSPASMPQPVSTAPVLRLGARGSMLSRMQSQSVADALEKRHPGLQVELVLIKTTGDRILDRPLHEAGGKGLFTKEIEQSILSNEIDLAVHSYKDVPVTMPLVDQADLVIAAVPPREDVRDVLVSEKAKSIAELPPNARVGTGSLRRQCQLLALRPDLRIELIRGNIDTRIRKLRAGEFDAILLAFAGLRRAGLFDGQDMTPIEPTDLLPAAGQGALALQCRRSDPRTRDLLAAIHDPQTAACVDLERDLVRALEGDCHSPIAALATLANDTITLQAAVGKAGGHPPVLRAQSSTPTTNTPQLLKTILAQLESQGARQLLHP